MVKRMVEVTPTAKELAACFCEIQSDEQAEFFNEIAILSQKWEGTFVFQLEGITNEECLTEGGRMVMEEIGQYSRPYTEGS